MKMFFAGSLIGVLRVWDGAVFESCHSGAERACFAPVYGYFYKDEKVLGRLFEALVERTVGSGCHYTVQLYAHDDAAIGLYSMMQFGRKAVTGVRKIPAGMPSAPEGFALCALTKPQTEARWTELWGLTTGILEQLKGSPVFYPCEEFTEEAYREFSLHEGTTVYAALDPAGRCVGMIESNRSCDALLRFAEAHEAERGAAYAWVEHGTANPAARGFRDKYFEPWLYEMVRRV